MKIAIVNGAENDLITSSAVDGIHVVNKSFHGLMYPIYRAVDGVL